MRSVRMARAVWLLLVILLLGGVGWWSVTLGGSLDREKPVTTAPSPPPVRANPAVVVEYPGQEHLTSAQLCAQVAPDYNAVIVDDPTGFVVANIRC